MAAAPCAHAQGPDGGDWGDWDDWGDFETFLDNREDPSDFDNDFDTDFEPDEILALNISRQGLAKARALGFRVQEQRLLRTLRFTMVRLRPPGSMSAARALARLREADPDGFYDRNLTYQLAGAAPGADAGGLASLSTASANAAAGCEGVRCYGQQLIGWARGCAARTRIGMLDSAIDAANPALTGRKIVRRRLHRSRPDARELEHGTAVAALLVGTSGSAFPGLLPEAELVAADVFSRGRDGALLTDAARLAAALDWVAGHEPAVINVSIAGPDGGVLRIAVRRLLEHGIALVAAAGNLGPQAPPQYPAAYPGVVAVTAVDRDLRVYAKANRGAYVSVAAPGVGIWTSGADGIGRFREGTSFAAPFATASLALLKAGEPRLTPASMLAGLKTRARDLGPPGNDPTFGWGLVQSGQCRI